MRLLSARRSLSVAAIPLLLVGVTACGGDDTSDKASDNSTAQPFGGGGGDTTQAPETDTTDAPETETTDSTDAPETDSTDAPDSEFSTGDNVSVEQFTDIMQSAIKSQEPSDMEMTMDAAGTTITASGSMDSTDPTDPKMSMTMQMGGGSMGGQDMTMEMLMVDKTVYMKTEALGTKWIKMSMDDFGSTAGMGDFTEQMDPTKSLENLVPGLKTITYAGETTRGDGNAHQYTVVVDPAKVDSLKSQAGMPSELTYELFFDDSDRIVGMDMDVAGATVDVTLKNFGTSVDIVAPPASEISTDGLAGLGSASS